VKRTNSQWGNKKSGTKKAMPNVAVGRYFQRNHTMKHAATPRGMVTKRESNAQLFCSWATAKFSMAV
jgi:hypothetical protein